MASQQAVDAANSAFWNEMRGSIAARSLGVVGNDRASLKKYDDWYLQYYPYLYRFIDFPSLRNRDVLEVGLGYGSVGQKIAESAPAIWDSISLKDRSTASITGWRNAASPDAQFRVRS
jgi:hypothetical protein